MKHSPVVDIAVHYPHNRHFIEPAYKACQNKLKGIAEEFSEKVLHN
jgi:hypothetical protein